MLADVCMRYNEDFITDPDELLTGSRCINTTRVIREISSIFQSGSSATGSCPASSQHVAPLCNFPVTMLWWWKVVHQFFTNPVFYFDPITLTDPSYSLLHHPSH